jgi:hypothetical protein
LVNLLSDGRHAWGASSSTVLGGLRDVVFNESCVADWEV